LFAVAFKGFAYNDIFSVTSQRGFKGNAEGLKGEYSKSTAQVGIDAAMKGD